MVKVEGSLAELRELFGDVKRTARTVKTAAKEVAKTATKTKRKLSEWQKYIKNKKNHIKFKSGSRKGRLNLSAMSKKFKASKRRK